MKISETHSFSQAAKELFITQPSLSQQIIKLEKELGVRLFERNGNTVILTKAGENFIKDAKQAILSFEQIKSDMECFRYAGKEHLRIAIRSTIFLYSSPSSRKSYYRCPIRTVWSFVGCFYPGNCTARFSFPGTPRASPDLSDGISVSYSCIDFSGESARSAFYFQPAGFFRQQPLLTGTDKQAFSAVVHLISQVDMQVELYLPQEGENPMDDRSVAFVLEGGHVPEQYRNCEIVPMALFDLYGISFLVHRQYQENDLIQAMVRHFTGKD